MLTLFSVRTTVFPGMGQPKVFPSPDPFPFLVDRECKIKLVDT